jgi:hypothetical protein
VCATLGELSEENKNSFFRLQEQHWTGDPTSNCVLQVILSDKDRQLWDQMDEATFKAIKVMAGNQHDHIEWWHQPKPWDKPGSWRKEHPGRDTIRMEGIVHEASLLPLGDGDNCCVDKDYKLKGVSNVVSVLINYDRAHHFEYRCSIARYGSGALPYIRLMVNVLDSFSHRDLTGDIGTPR